MKKFSLSEFNSKKRDPLLDYEVYAFNFDDRVDGFDVVRKSLSKPEAQLVTVDPYRRMVAVKQQAWDVMDHLANCYSAGHSVAELRDIYPAALEYWNSYFERFQIFLNWENNANKDLAAFPLMGTEFEIANQLVCFGILLGWGGLLANVTHIIDKNNFRKDAMIERLLDSYVSDRSVIESECTRHLPYFKTLKIFDADSLVRSDMMKDYLAEWYQASRREGYYNSHKRGDEFKGYWSWESAAITYLLDINDNSYRDAKFYPADLVEFACNIQAPRSSTTKSTSHHELRAKSGQVCPKSGNWQTLDIPLQQRNFTFGEIMQAENASYGITVWRYIGD